MLFLKIEILESWKYNEVIKAYNSFMEGSIMADISKSKYAGNFAFLLRCKKCGNVLRELGGDAYTAEQALLAVKQSDETCPVCGSKDWGKLRRILASNADE